MKNKNIAGRKMMAWTSLLIVFSLVLAACQAAATATEVATQPVVAASPTNTVAAPAASGEEVTLIRGKRREVRKGDVFQIVKEEFRRHRRAGRCGARHPAIAGTLSAPARAPELSAEHGDCDVGPCRALANGTRCSREDGGARPGILLVWRRAVLCERRAFRRPGAPIGERLPNAGALDGHRRQRHYIDRFLRGPDCKGVTAGPGKRKHRAGLDAREPRFEAGP